MYMYMYMYMYVYVQVFAYVQAYVNVYVYVHVYVCVYIHMYIHTQFHTLLVYLHTLYTRSTWTGSISIPCIPCIPCRYYILVSFLLLSLLPMCTRSSSGGAASRTRAWWQSRPGLPASTSSLLLPVFTTVLTACIYYCPYYLCLPASTSSLLLPVFPFLCVCNVLWYQVWLISVPVLWHFRFIQCCEMSKLFTR